MADYIFTTSGLIESEEPDDIIPETTEADFEASAPCIMRKLGSGLTNFDYTTISGTLTTTDSRDAASLMFILGYIDGPDDGAEYAHYYNGYGIAIRPLTDDSPDGAPNVFIVDNALAVRDVVLENVLHTGWGDYAYLAATNANIESGEDYNFRLDFGPEGQIQFWIWPTDAGSIPLNPTIEYGSYDHQAEGSYWGLSCSNTGGYQWIVRNIDFSSRLDNYAINYSKLSTRYLFGNTGALKALAMGTGANVGASTPGVEMWLYNWVTASWDLIDTHTATVGGPSALLSSGAFDLTSYMDSSLPNHYLHVLIVTSYPASFEDSVDSVLNVDYVWLENWDAVAAHVGGRGDVYIRESSQPTYAYIDIYNASQLEYLVPTNTKIQNTFLLPMLWPDSVELLDINGNPTGTYLAYNVDWSMSVESLLYRFSAEEILALILAADGYNLRIHYYTYPNITAAQDYCDEALHKNVTEDYLIRACQPMELFIEMTVVGTATLLEIRAAMASWINGTIPTSLSYSDIAAFVQSLDGVTDATVTSLIVRTHEYDGSYNDETIASNGTATITDYQQFILLGDVDHIGIS